MIYLYKRGTGMGRLARELRVSVLLLPEERPVYRRFNQELWINWGCVRLPDYLKAGEDDQKRILNYSISNAASKVRAFELLGEAGIQIPRWSKTLKELINKVKPDQHILARRDGLSKGKGIRVISPEARLNAVYEPDFFVERLSCKREFRCHVWSDRVICLQAKVVPPGCQNFIHNYENGCHYTTQMLDRWISGDLRSQIEVISIQTSRALGLDFGAVDLLLTKKDRLYVLEVNTAPGLRSEATYSAYREALRGEMKGEKSLP